MEIVSARPSPGIFRTPLQKPDSTLGAAALAKIDHFRSVYGIEFPAGIATRLASGLDRLPGLLRKEGIRLERDSAGAKAMFWAARLMFPHDGRWLHELFVQFAIHHDETADHFPFLLKAARLVHGAALEDALLSGFKDRDLRDAERGKKLGREHFRQLCRRYRLERHPAEESYMGFHYPRLPETLERLTYSKGRIAFMTEDEVRQLAIYEGIPSSTAEWFYFLRTDLCLNKGEMARLIGMNIGQYGALERRRSREEGGDARPSLKTCLETSRKAGAPIDEILLAILEEYSPDLLDLCPRLRKEPVYLDHRKTMDADARKLDDYGMEPGSSGERRFFARKRLFLSLEDYAALSGADRHRLSALEEVNADPIGCDNPMFLASGPLRPSLLVKRKIGRLRALKGPVSGSLVEPLCDAVDRLEKKIDRVASRNWTDVEWISLVRLAMPEATPRLQRLVAFFSSTLYQPDCNPEFTDKSPV